MPQFRAPRAITLTALVIGLALVVAGRTADGLEIGAAIPNPSLKMVTTSGDEVSFNDVRKAKGILVMFSCNTCPWVDKWEDRYHTVAAAAAEAGIGMILLNPNAALRDGEESLAAMTARAKDRGYTFPYAVDKDAAMADAFGASRTPEAYLFNDKLTLIYHGAIDDNARDAAAVESHFLLDAIAQYSAGKSITMQETKSIGCTIKRKKA
jgi:hypothetical protein